MHGGKYAIGQFIIRIKYRQRISLFEGSILRMPVLYIYLIHDMSACMCVCIRECERFDNFISPTFSVVCSQSR